MKKNTLIVNLIASPSSGKSTLMAGVFSKLKLLNIDCEMATEFAKELVWEERHKTFQDEIYIFGKQQHRINRLNGQVDVVITDRPIILTSYYNSKYGDPYNGLNQLCLNEFKKYRNLNYFVNRKKPYNPNGRNQTEKESDQIAIELRALLDTYQIPYTDIDGNENGINQVVNNIIKILRR